MKNVWTYILSKIDKSKVLDLKKGLDDRSRAVDRLNAAKDRASSLHNDHPDEYTAWMEQKRSKYKTVSKKTYQDEFDPDMI